MEERRDSYIKGMKEKNQIREERELEKERIR